MQAPPERYDTILCSSGMLYLQDVQAAIEKFSSWLEEDGMLCFNTPQVLVKNGLENFLVSSPQALVKYDVRVFLLFP